jgi:hypothetical protein
MTTFVQYLGGILAAVEKTPAEIEDFTIDWSTRGLGSDVIASSSWASSAPDELSVSAQSPLHDTTTATVWLSGGIADMPYIVTNTITTSPGNRTLQESFVVSCIPYRFITS